MTRFTVTATIFAAAFTLATAPVHAAGVPGQHFIENWDMSGDGIVSLAEVIERRGDIFLTFDADENGFIDANEYVAFDEARAEDMKGQGGANGHGKGAMKNMSEGMTLAFNDADNDGEVSRDEFLGAVDRWMELVDRDGDNAITTADFGPKK